MFRPMDIKEISRLLADRIDTLVPHILPNAVRGPRDWFVGSVYGEKGSSMAIGRGVHNKGTWCDFADGGMKGDALDLVSHVKCGGDKKKAVAWAKSWLGIENVDPKKYEVIRKEAARKAKEQDKKARAALEKTKAATRRLWLQSDPHILKSPVDLYLAGRGIDLSSLPRIPGALRFARECFCAENGVLYPAMVAAITSPEEKKQIAVHRTYLEASGSGFAKASLRDAKKVWGPYMGGHIPLSRGKSGKPLRDAPDDDVVVICEGIEDGLSIMVACPDYRVLAAVSVGNFRNITLPPQIRTVVFAADNDPEWIMVDDVKKPHPARKALDAAADIFADQGRDVYIARAPSGKDFNDLLVSGGSMVVDSYQEGAG